MSERLREVIQRILNSNGMNSATEMAVRQGVVLPILDTLGWDIWNVGEVIPEYVVGQNRVDYCLAIQGKGKVFLETKAAREDLNAHREQLLKYAFQTGIPLAVLTSGLKWSFYVPLREGPWDKRCFMEVDLSKESLTEVERKLGNYLSRSSVHSGAAATEAARAYESVQRVDEIEQALPKAWNKIIQGPDGLLVDLLIETVEEICQHRPERKRIEDFVTNLPSFSAPEIDMNRKPLPKEPKTIASPGNPNNFPASVPPAFLKYGALSVKSQYRAFLPPNQDGVPVQERTYFTVNFPRYGETKAYMSQGRLKIRDAAVWREIVTKLGIEPDDAFMVRTVKPSQHYEVNKC